MSSILLFFKRFNKIFMQKATLIFIFIFFAHHLSQANDAEQKERKIKKIKNVKTYSGPMGMGLIKSFEIGDEKKCIYNTISGQVKVSLENKMKICPKNIKK